MTNKELKQKLIDLELCKNNKYLTKYIKLIISNVNTEKQKGYDRHHIIPKYYYKHNNIDLDNSLENLVFLSRSDHLLAHLYLCFCSINDKYMYANAYAVNMFINQKHTRGKDYKSIITYDLEDFILQHKDDINKASKIFSELQSKRLLGKHQSIDAINKRVQKCKEKGVKPNLNKTGLYFNGQYRFIPNDKVDYYIKHGAILGRRPHSEESKEKNRQSHLGKSLPHTDEWNKAISKGSKGKKLSEECKRKISDTLKGNTEKCGHIREKIAINNGKIYKYVLEKDFINIYGPQGWIKGTGNKNTCKNRGLIRINNETGAKYVTLDEWENKYSKEGWHRGYDWKK